MVKKGDNSVNQKFPDKDLEKISLGKNDQSKSFLQDVQELQVIAQLIDNMDVIVDRLEKAYNEKDGQKFKESKEEILKSQKKIGEMLK